MTYYYKMELKQSRFLSRPTSITFLKIKWGFWSIPGALSSLFERFWAIWHLYWVYMCSVLKGLQTIHGYKKIWIDVLSCKNPIQTKYITQCSPCIIAHDPANSRTGVFLHLKVMAKLIIPKWIITTADHICYP